MSCTHTNHGLADGICVDCGVIAPQFVERLLARLAEVETTLAAYDALSGYRSTLRLAKLFNAAQSVVKVYGLRDSEQGRELLRLLGLDDAAREGGEK